MTENRTNARGQLSIWTDIEPEDELDFNRWYDREHMQERIAIPGFRRARRYRATADCPRPYLALYDTAELGVFTSPAYRRALAGQTEWSLRNFARMRGTQRRVGTLAIETGAGEGGALALLVVPEGVLDTEAWRPRLADAVQGDHVVHAALLRTDVALSTPLTAGAPPARADGLLLVEATGSEAAAAAARALAAHLPRATGEVFTFQLMWRLGA